MDEDKKKKGKFSFLATLGMKNPAKDVKQDTETTWKDKAGSYLETKQSKKKKLDEAFKY